MPGLVTALKTPCTMCTTARSAQHATTMSRVQAPVFIPYSSSTPPPTPTAEKQNVFENKGSTDVLEVSKAASGICLPVFFISFKSCLLIRMWIPNTGTSTPVISFIFDIRYDKILTYFSKHIIIALTH